MPHPHPPPPVWPTLDPPLALDPPLEVDPLLYFESMQYPPPPPWAPLPYTKRCLTPQVRSARPPLIYHSGIQIQKKNTPPLPHDDPPSPCQPLTTTHTPATRFVQDVSKENVVCFSKSSAPRTPGSPGQIKIT